MRSYQDFDLHIRPIGYRYRAHVVASLGGQAYSDFDAPFSDDDFKRLLSAVGPRRTSRPIGTPEETEVKALGSRLFAAVFTGEVLACLRTSIDRAKEQNKGLRIRLHLVEVPELADLPWEYLYSSALNRFLSASLDTPVVRYLELAEPVRPLKVNLPIRVLVMVANPADSPPLDVESEWSKLKTALADLEAQGQVAVERLPEASLQALQRRLRGSDCHIFHFIGHGAFDTQANNGVLIFEGREGRGEKVSGEHLGMILHDHWQLRVAVLNACEGARAGRADPFSGTAQSLVQQGVAAVIAMQFEITDEAAVLFAHELYRALADGFGIDSALSEARKVLRTQLNDVEWGTPVLFMRASDGRIFDVAPMENATGASKRPMVEDRRTSDTPSSGPASRWEEGVGADSGNPSNVESLPSKGFCLPWSSWNRATACIRNARVLITDVYPLRASDVSNLASLCKKEGHPLVVVSSTRGTGEIDAVGSVADLAIEAKDVDAQTAAELLTDLAAYLGGDFLSHEWGFGLPQETQTEELVNGIARRFMQFGDAHIYQCLPKASEISVEGGQVCFEAAGPLPDRRQYLALLTNRAMNCPGSDEEFRGLLNRLRRLGAVGPITRSAARSVLFTEESEGITLPVGMASPYFVNADSRCRLDDAKLLVASFPLLDSEDVVPALEVAGAGSDRLVVVAPRIEGKARALLIMNRLRGIVLTLAVETRNMDQLSAIARLTGARLIGKEDAEHLSAAYVHRVFGRARKVEAGFYKTRITG
jgi:hypothetical protein